MFASFVKDDGDLQLALICCMPLQPVDQPPPYAYYTTIPETQLPEEPSSNRAVPPPAQSTSRSPEPIPASPPFVTPPANFVSLIETHKAVKGSWTIDTALAPAPAFLQSASSSSLPSPPPTPGFFQRLMSIVPDTSEKYPGPTPNLKLKSTHGRVEANVRVVRGSSESAPARLDLRTTHGAIRLNVVSVHSLTLNNQLRTSHQVIDFLRRSRRCQEARRDSILLRCHHTGQLKFSCPGTSRD